ncbi:MAG: tRNA (N6-threonylcarbamoyladenosine(37)-N6)-methyltransferase TrmO [Polyangiaceae bacterium]
MQPLTLTPIGVAHTPFADRVSAPRQPYAARGVRGTIELTAGHNFEHALEDLAGWDFIWVLFWFHLNEGWRPKVLPPRSTERRGVFSTRSPYRPNPIGLSVVRLERVEGLVLHVVDVDLIDGTPILDIKPYVPAADAITDAKTGWLQPLDAQLDPEPGFDVRWSALATRQASWLLERFGIEVTERVNATLKLGPQPHAYRRIRVEQNGISRLAVKEWRFWFSVDGRTIEVQHIGTGYRERDLKNNASSELDAHRAFVHEFGDR